ncbi:MAG TPA: Ig-like domain-containing protein, partial [Vulgatibacter sp.]
QTLTVSATGLTSVDVHATAVAGSAATLAIDWDPAASGTVGQTLADSVVVTVTDFGGNPVEGVTVTFASADTGASVGSPTATTDEDGKASTTWTLGTLAGQQTLTVSVPVLSPVDIHATAVADEATNLVVDWDPAASGTVGQTLAEAVVATVTDTYGNPIEGVTVTFATTDTGASVASPTATTDADGQASTTWTLGTAAGQQTLTVSSIGLTSVDVHATAVAGAATNLTIDWDPAASGTVGETLADSVVATVSDTYGNPIEGVTVTFSTADVDASVGSPTATTDSDGSASTTWTLGTVAGQQSLTVSVSGIAPQTIHATATALPINILEIHAGNGQYAPPNQEFGAAFVVRLLDENGDPVEGGTINFTALGVTLSSDTATTDEDGLAWVTATTGPTEVWVVEIEASEDGGTSSVTFEAYNFDFPTGGCYGYGPHFQGPALHTLSGLAPGEYSMGTVGDHELRVLLSPAVGAGTNVAGVALSCSDGTDDHLLEVYPSAVYLDGAALQGTGLPGLFVSEFDGTWSVNCGATLDDVVVDISVVDGFISEFGVVPTTWTGGICSYDGVTAPGIVGGATFFDNAP